jgi:outer membrane protein assembly factor BamB
MPRILPACLMLCACLLAPGAWADTLYGVSLRAYADSAGGNLYTVDPGTAEAKIVGPLRLRGTQPISLRGIAVHPKTHVFYGITAGLNAAVPALITIDPATGNATFVGPLGRSGSDINFDGKGQLYIWLTDSNELGLVDLGTGAARAIAPSATKLSESVGGGFGMRQDGVAFVSATSATGTLDFIDTRTGGATVGPRLVGAPFVSGFTAMDFASDGRLFAVNSNMGAPASTVLTVIDPDSGAVHAIGPLPPDMTALAFAPDNDEITVSFSLRRTTLEAIAALLVLALAAAFAIRIRRGR